MKKLLLGAALLAGMTTANAQLADGTAAPDFTATDLNGVSHTLSDYLNAGKTVIIDISATWCGPCWSYHNTHALADFYQSYGPDGSDEVMVFFVEGDGSTSVADLHGTGSNTQGDWVTGTPYPILNSSAIANSYAISYFPTIYRICPDGLVYEINQLTASQLRSNVNSNCGTLTGVTNRGEIHDEELALCTSDAAPAFTFKNYGTNAITSATANLFADGVSVGTANYSGSSVAQWSEGTITFPTMTLNPAVNYTVELETVNGVANNNPDASFGTLDVSATNESSTLDVTVNIVTDAYGTETTWTLKNGAGVTVASGGPYNDLTASGTTTQTPVNVSLNLADCYTMTVLDSYGDGMDSGYGVGYWNIKDGSGATLVSGGAFASEDKGVFRTSTVGIEENELAGVNVFPNPTSGIINITNLNNDENTIEIRDIAGKVVYSSVANSTVKVDLTSNASGIYFVKVSNEVGSKVVKVTLK